jgi:hypothetical protein
VTLPISEEQLARALEQARENVARGSFPKVKKSQLRESFAERLHPRDRLGRFIDKPNFDRYETIGDMLAKTDWHQYMPTKFDPDVEAINSPEDATRFLQGLGFQKSSMTPPEGYDTPSAHWYREVAQAVKDASTKFPALKNGEHPLAGVVIFDPDLIDPDEFDDDARGGVWAFTGSDPAEGHVTVDRVRDGTSGLFVGINPDGEPYKREMDVSSFAAPAGGSIYGRMMHEMGHAVSQANGFSFDEKIMPQVFNGVPEFREGYANILRDYEFSLTDPEIAMFTLADIRPSELAAVSNYSQKNPAEAFAELFTTMNTPHGADFLDPSLRDHLFKARDAINAAWERLRPGKGDLL